MPNATMLVVGGRLEWDGKSAQVPRLHLPLRVVETVNSPRADRGTIFEDSPAGESDGSWRNRLIWGDNLHARSTGGHRRPAFCTCPGRISGVHKASG